MHEVGQRDPHGEDPDRISFEHLPHETQRWLRDLRPVDIHTLNAAIKFQEQARTIGRFGKWLLLSLAGLVLFLSGFGDALIRISSWFSSKGSP